MRRYYLDRMDILCRKSFYPYAWINGIEKPDYEGIPPIDAFSSELKIIVYYMMMMMKIMKRQR